MLRALSKILPILILPLLFGCSTTKSLKDGEAFYKGSRIHTSKIEISGDWKVDNSSEKLSRLYIDLWDTPNGGIFGTTFGVFLPTRLYIYNWFYNDKTEGVNAWVRANFGEQPITIGQINPELKTQKGISVYENFGHFGTTGHYRFKL